MENTAKPLKMVLLPSTVPLRASMTHAANLLPTPLYICFSQLVAAREALNLGCTTSIFGNVTDAENYASSLGNEAPQGNDAKPTLEDLYKVSGTLWR